MNLPVLSQKRLGFACDLGPSAPPWLHKKTVEWQVCGRCNYDCSYCIQSKKHRVGAPDEDDVHRMLSFLNALEGQWEIKMTGGEPFASPLFLSHIIKGLAEGPHAISLLTNLSVSKKRVTRFAEMVRGQLRVLSASLHFEFAELKPFLEKLHTIRKICGDAPDIVVNNVLVPATLEQSLRAKRVIEGEGFRYFGQLMKVKKAVYAYDQNERALIEKIVGNLDLARRTRSANMAPEYLGHRCFTGASYFVLMQNGDAWSCRSAKRNGDGYLGNVLKGDAQLLDGPHVCPYAICPCSVPANRGMIEGVLAKLNDAAADETGAP